MTEYTLGFPNLEVSAAFTNSLLDIFVPPEQKYPVKIDDSVYLLEFKVDMPEQEALAQIKTRGYPEKYRTRGKKITLICIGFSSKEKNITEFTREEVQASGAPTSSIR